jgi:hypothetical protein
MSYEFHIRRVPPLTLDEWKSAVDATDSVTLDGSGASSTNPKTGEVIFVGGAEGDAKINFEGDWYPCFRWHQGSVAFRVGIDPHEIAWRAARQLALRLGARLIGDGGEEYR